MLILGRKPGEGVAIGLNDGFTVGQVASAKAMLTVWHRERPGLPYTLQELPISRADELGQVLEMGGHTVRLVLIEAKLAPTARAAVGIEAPKELEVLRIELLDKLQKENNIPIWAQHD